MRNIGFKPLQTYYNIATAAFHIDKKLTHFQQQKKLRLKHRILEIHGKNV